MTGPRDTEAVNLLKTILHDYVDETSQVFAKRANDYQHAEPEIYAELLEARDRYRQQADEAINLIREGEFTLTDLKHIASTLYLTHLVLRWFLEQQTTSFQEILKANPEAGGAVERASLRMKNGDDDAFNDLIRLVERNRDYYPLLMTMGFIYLRYKQNLNYAMKYFEKAAASPPPVETEHYRTLALQFLAICHEKQKQHKNALTVLLRAESKNPHELDLLYSIARTYAILGQEDPALEYFERAVRRHPAFYSMATIDPAFDNIRQALELRLISYNKTFRELSRRFQQLVQKAMDLVDDYDLEEYDHRLGKQVSRVRQQVATVRRGYYSGYRNGIIRFFISSFPDVLQIARNALLRKRRDDEKKLRARARKIVRRSKRAGWTLSPILFAGAGVGVWMFQGPLLVRVPVRFPYMEFVLPAVAGTVVVILFAGWLAGFRKKSLQKLDGLGELTSAASAVELLEKNLKNFWLNEVSAYVDATPVWAKKPVRKREMEMVS